MARPSMACYIRADLSIFYDNFDEVAEATGFCLSSLFFPPVCFLAFLWPAIELKALFVMSAKVRVEKRTRLLID